MATVWRIVLASGKQGGWLQPRSVKLRSYIIVDHPYLVDIYLFIVESEKAVVCSSVGSGNSLDGPSESPSLSVKRKHSDVQDIDCHSEDVEGESGDGRKEAAPSRTGTGSKRSRRRDRINEKMRALQELIPNCNKVDKASMLDEAIEYLKSLQLQVQIMSMASGYYMPPVMFPPGMGHYPAAAAAMAMGMGMPYAMGLPDMSRAGPSVNHGPQFQVQGMQQPVGMAIPRVSGGGFFTEGNGVNVAKQKSLLQLQIPLPEIGRG
ncbi:hypothetical protein F2Q70_00041949 [Brassica cretica]|uniref:BHLH domain-containing protein n=1 Tax=Brassica cretica TaxID=69181 RepID=A0A8S9KET1_BRACR|nr:hypothetical protein F2Q70_00041949 [Brassica cretica]